MAVSLKSFIMKLAFVIPWYGDSIPGGAEAECRSTAKALQARGYQVEVLTTCVREFLSDWNVNFHPSGESVEGGILVRRFPVRERDTKTFDEVNYKLMHNMPISHQEEGIFVRENVNSPAMYDYIGKNSAGYVFLFIPYMFGTTYWGSQVCPERSLLIPCLHDESYAYMELFRDLFPHLTGHLLHTDSERRLAERLYRLSPERAAVIGEGVDSDWQADANRFTRKYGLSNFILYAGRRDTGKNLALLIEYFCRYRQESGENIDLVLLGKGQIEIPSEGRNHVYDLGFLPLQDKYDCFAAASFFCLPSLYESFSIVMMEAWLAGTPVVVYEPCEVTKEHCRDSNGGLFFADYDEFAEIASELHRNKDLRGQLAANGKNYVLANYTWDRVCSRFADTLAYWGWEKEDFLRHRHSHSTVKG
jgi:glycosyltransferase involved in cell wall biosynthesis